VVGLHQETHKTFGGTQPSMKFGYCIFYVPSVECALELFEKAFHQRRRFLHDSGMYGELDTGSTVLAFASHEMGDANLNGDYAKTNAIEKPFGMELAFVVDDVPSAYAHAVTCGCIAVREPKTKPWGQTVAYVRTMDGILIELCTQMNG
jgi:lactoylglutathione lyase